ncbi:MAG TPA: hypothetical protein VE077_10600, partial [Candidatus Methylomirabilis sp.]|nr:hypothetical protein [Candidatus Methylomirabilis sp.]
MGLFSNPEIVRNARAQLRLRRMGAAAGICAALSLVLIYSNAENQHGFRGRGGGAEALFLTILWIQLVVMAIGGGIASLYAIQREKEQNTFDFQRVTRLSPMELTIGKLFGTPLTVYFVFLCLMPAALIGAGAAGIPWTLVLVAYVVLILGTFAYQSIALLISLLLGRGTLIWAVLGYLVLLSMTANAGNGGTEFAIGMLSPMYAPFLVQMKLSNQLESVSRQTDLFFGRAVPHALVLCILYLTVLAWLVPAVARNIKRDPAEYEVYSPMQALGLLFYLNFILFAFFQWGTATKLALNGSRFSQVSMSGLDEQEAMLSLNILLFFIYGFILLRNRSRMRRKLHSAREAVSEWVEALWPAPYILLGTLVVGAALVGVIAWRRNTALEWSLSFAIFQVVFLACWLARDLLFLQWMNLRRGRKPLMMGVVYLGVFYICVSIL